MSKNLQTPTKLTEFGPIQAEDPKPASVSQFLANFFWKKTSSEDPNGDKSDATSDNLPSWAVETASNSPNQPDAPASNVYEVDLNEGRSLPNVLKRISNLLALKSSNLQDYSETELKQYWMPDSVSKECYECSEKFTTFRRRHHCRVCGQIFCWQCCSQQIPGKIFGCTGELRVCTYCCKVVLSYLQSSDFNVVLSNDLKMLQESLQVKFGVVSTKSLEDNTSRTSSADKEGCGNKKKNSVCYQEEKFFYENSNASYLSNEEKSRALRNSTSLRNLYEEIAAGVQFETHRYKQKTYGDCAQGSDLVDWLIFQNKSKNRVQASAMCQALLEAGYIESLSDPTNFIDGYAFYRKKLINYPELSSSGTDFDVQYSEEPHWVQQIPHDSNITDSDSEQIVGVTEMRSSSSYMLDLNVEANTVYLSRPLNEYNQQVEQAEQPEVKETDVVRPSKQVEVAPESGWFNASHLREENGEKLAYTVLQRTFEQHKTALFKQILRSKGLSYAWSSTVQDVLQRLIGLVRPDKNHDAIDLDIRHYVRFKTLPGASKADTALVEGIVCSKNVAHIDMKTDIDHPRILLLQCSVVYQRTEGRLMSLEPILMQEYEYLRNVAARIVALRPHVVLVQKNVSRLAQEMLRRRDVTLVRNVKRSVMERLARCTGADLVTAVDAHIGRPELGTCARFYVRNYKTDRGKLKTLMHFEGLPGAHLGATVLLRGAAEEELKKVKEAAELMLFASYNWRLELSFLMDEFAVPANAEGFLDDSPEDGEVKVVPSTETEQARKIDRPAIKRFVKDEKTLVDDFTDPLHSAQAHQPAAGGPSETLSVARLPFADGFKKHLDDVVLCVSPHVVVPPPYLETEAGKRCSMRRFFPDCLYYSRSFESAAKTKRKGALDGRAIAPENRDKSVKALHPFLAAKLTMGVEEAPVQDLLAHFRACGGRYAKKETIRVEKARAEAAPFEESEANHKDVLDPVHHQRLAVLFCSYSTESNNAPAFCVNPWIVYMDFYGRNDIPLGCFLERYCFRPSYECPSLTCDTPMAGHVRKFVHNAGCVTVGLNHFDQAFADDGVCTWTWCTGCQTVSPIATLSADSWSYPFAKYLEIKFYGDAYGRRGPAGCSHSLHQDHYQYFGYKNYVATFKYTAITIWEISLPPRSIEVHLDSGKLHRQLVDDVKSTAQKGHDFFVSISEKLKAEETELNGSLRQILAKEQANFKQSIDDLQMKLTSPSLERKPFDEKEVHLSYWKLSDTLTRLKRSLVEIVEMWNGRLSDFITRKKDSNDKKKEKTEDSTEIQISSEEKETKKIPNDYTESESCTSSIESCQNENTTNNQPAEDSTDGKKETDKKTVKNILSNLLQLPSNSNSLPAPFPLNEHYLADSSIPVVVIENEPSSIVAYTLASQEYAKLLDELTSRKTHGDSFGSPSTKRKLPVNADKDKLDNSSEQHQQEAQQQQQDDAKKARKAHVEVQFQDGNSNFFCRAYMAQEFAELRRAVLSTGEEGYVRSLSRSAQWDARGGKSGSNFSKTTDDRFVLKEMSKTEVHLFLESCSNYFGYVHRCQSSGQPTLLGKILGVYQIVFKNSSNVPYRSNVLVMENLFYGRKSLQKFDLKGSMRNRLVTPDRQSDEIVLLDENLMKMTCESPLYVLPHSKAVLMSAIQSDTEFLSTQSVMDYSLLVGLDAENKEIVLGIIDYIRTFTWDKKLETMVKRSGILGGQGKLPTIISPEEYRKRFIEAMHKYFLEVPDHWTGLGKSVEF
ncbi:unnamed protein product [Phyllotreta striolata]|uniref:1-phosphatidylinositol-3-phosphate 5-kinase n=1 Tax=Phyllotreta striolata TaxID=444603 RepID=A0A9N9TM73_PHYSR|nr:unnamed protein product [Phyllotreta striolata]